MDDIKIVFVDLDGTLAKDKRRIDISNKVAIDRLNSIGIPVVLTTGRSLFYSESLCKQFGLSNYVITSNGAGVYNYLTKKVIYRNIISKEDIRKMDLLIKKYNLFYTAHTLERDYTNKENYFPNIYVKDLIELEEKKIVQLVIQSYNIEDMKLLRRDLSPTNLEIVNKSKEIIEGEKLYYDIVNKGTSKGNAVKELCEFLNIDLKKTMVIGDSYNDISMFDVAGFKVAVENALPMVKEKADFITLSNKDNGVSLVLNDLYIELMKRR